MIERGLESTSDDSVRYEYFAPDSQAFTLLAVSLDYSSGMLSVTPTPWIDAAFWHSENNLK